MKYIRLSNSSLQDKSNKQVYFDFLVVGGQENSIDYNTFFPVLEETIPNRLLSETMDSELDQNEIILIKTAFGKRLNDLISTKEEKPDGQPGTFKISGKTIHLSLREPKDKIIHLIDRIIQITDDCLKNDRPMFLTIEEK